MEHFVPQPRLSSFVSDDLLLGGLLSSAKLYILGENAERETRNIFTEAGEDWRRPPSFAPSFIPLSLSSFLLKLFTRLFFCVCDPERVMREKERAARRRYL